MGKPFGPLFCLGKKRFGQNGQSGCLAPNLHCFREHTPLHVGQSLRDKLAGQESKQRTGARITESKNEILWMDLVMDLDGGERIQDSKLVQLFSLETPNYKTKMTIVIMPEISACFSSLVILCSLASLQQDGSRARILVDSWSEANLGVWL